MIKKLRNGLNYKHFAHPYDIAGMHRLVEKLQQNNILKDQLESIQVSAEDEFFLLNIADNIRLSRKQGASIYQLVENVADVFSIETPKVFLDNNSQLNAYAFGGSNPSIVLTSALIEQFSDDMVSAVIGHEIGHIICKHTFYRLLAEYYNSFASLVSLIPFLGSILGISMRWYLFDWYRKSELTADRAALLATQDVNIVNKTILYLAGGSSRIAKELDLSVYLNQADEFTEIMWKKREGSSTEKTSFLLSGFMLQHAVSTHPWPAVRLKEIEKWARSEHYNMIIEGEYEKAVQSTNSVVVEGEILLPPPPGEDIKEYIKDFGKSASESFKNIFKGSKKEHDTNEK
jgi:Zn-dependent protease with chaperone function